MIILFGSTGYIGSEFKRQLEYKNIPFFAWPNTRGTSFFDLIRWQKQNSSTPINFVINAAGYTGKPNVDACELNKEDTINGNIIWPQILTDWCILNEIPLGHVSSGCIYTGKREDKKGFTEEDEPNFTFKQNNCSFYSGTKAISEKIIRKWENSFIWRLRIPFEENDNPRNYISKLLNYKYLLNCENSVSNKQEFVSSCIETIIKRVPYGIYNITNTGSLTTKDLIEKIKISICPNKLFSLINEKDFYMNCAKTPRSNCVLDNSKLLSVGIKIKTVDESIDYCLKNWKQ